jgi:hypothetical protein
MLRQARMQAPALAYPVPRNDLLDEKPVDFTAEIDSLKARVASLEEHLKK